MNQLLACTIGNVAIALLPYIAKFDGEFLNPTVSVAAS
jgi:hypothetical protein